MLEDWKCYKCSLIPDPPAHLEDALSLDRSRDDEAPEVDMDMDMDDTEINPDHDPLDIDEMEFDVSADFNNTADIHEDTLDDEFDLSDFDLQTPNADSDFDDPEFPVNQPVLKPVFEILKGGTSRGKDMLLDNIGYTYCVKVNMSFIYD